MHDDQVDALGLIGQLIDHARPGTAPKPTGALSGYTSTRPRGSDSWRLA